MENVVIEEQSYDAAECGNESQNFKQFESADNFQKFIYELFEKNGILNDLRAYLRGHIVNVLKSAQTGDPPTCQKHFTQRLELTFQALNMLIAEYLLRLEFSYTMSVFVSEIPLANMVFDLAKSLLHNPGEEAALRFKDTDVWSVLNYLGIKCDSEHASNIVQMYKADNQPLLLCILKCIPMYLRESVRLEQLNSSEHLTSSARSSDSAGGKPKGRRSPTGRERCQHHMYCKACHSRILRMRDKYKKKNKSYAKNLNQTGHNQMSGETLMKNISVLEQNLVDEMFQQLKAVYEAEVGLMKEEEDKRVKRSLTTHAMQLQKRREEMEEAFNARTEELERNVQQKKRFLWGLARALRDQHGQMARAMLAVRCESQRLSDKEDSFKKQLLEAEEILKTRGEEMRKQISNELVILEGHLESMKSERDSLHRERSELEELRSLCDRDSNIIKINNTEPNEDLRSHYDLLKNELSILRKYLESTKEAKCVMDRSTLTELSGVASKLNVLNNEQDADRSYAREEERGLRTPNQVVNDFKKSKNVNFSQANLDEVYRERSRVRSCSSASSVGGESAAAGGSQPPAPAMEVSHLRGENERLKTIARQQRDHIDELSSQQRRLQAELTAAQFRAGAAAGPWAPVGQWASAGPWAPAGPWSSTGPWRPRTAPAHMPHSGLFNGRSVNATASANSFGCRRGAGEELAALGGARPRALAPGDAVPFVGALSDRHTDARRHLINQWRALRRRYSPLGAAARLRGEPPSRDTIHRDRPCCCPGPSAREPQAEHLREDEGTGQQLSRFTYQARETVSPRSRPSSGAAEKNRREMSPKSLLREAKERLKNKDTSHKNVKAAPPTPARDKSPNSVLREAKLRLRKLEIEAEAVERSYLDFRKRQTELREEWTQRRSYSVADEDEVVTKDVEVSDSRRSRSLQKFDETYKLDQEQSYHRRDKQAIKRDFDKYLLEYETALKVGSHFTNRNAVASRVKPIPQPFTIGKDDIERANDNYLETPLTEFRKLYHSPKSSMPSRMDKTQIENILTKNTGDDAPNNTNNEGIEPSRSCSSFIARKDALIKEKISKKAELEILKHNINKMYNLNESPTNDTPEKQSLVGNLEAPVSDRDVIEINGGTENNLFRIEVETVSESEHQDVLLVVQSSVETREVIHSDSEVDSQRISTNMTILISPKRSSPCGGDGVSIDRVKSPARARRSISPEQAARLTRNDVLDAIFHTNLKESSSVTIQPTSKEGSITEVGKETDLPEDYPDDFSADVDNYNSRSEYDRSPISLPKSYEDEHFWDS